MTAAFARNFDRARPVGAEPPMPLSPPIAVADPHPKHALGSLSAVSGAIERTVQVPAAMAGQSVLATAALAAQSIADVRLPYGQTRPLSCFFATVAASGDRKSSADNEASRPIRRREEALRQGYEADIAEHKINLAAWAAEKRKIEGDKTLDLHTRKIELQALGPEPRAPLLPFVVAPEPTAEGLIKAWPNCLPSLGIFSAEGGMFTGGHGMAPENKLRSAAAFSSMWDGAPVKRVRSGDGVTILNDRRLLMHLMVQIDAATAFFSDSVLRDQGLLSRMLVACPDSIAGARLWRQPNAADEAIIRAYSDHILKLLELGSRMGVDELRLRVLGMDPESVDLWTGTFDTIEKSCGRDGPLLPIQDFAAKALEHAARLAGVMTIVADPEAGAIEAKAMSDALELVAWYLSQALRLHASARTDPKLLRAAAPRLAATAPGSRCPLPRHPDLRPGLAAQKVHG